MSLKKSVNKLHTINSKINQCITKVIKERIVFISSLNQIDHWIALGSKRKAKSTFKLISFPFEDVDVYYLKMRL